MATPPFKYEPMFQLGPDTTEYYLLTKDYVSVSEFEGKPILKIEKEGLTAMANAAFRDVSFMLRRSHNEQVAKILSDPERQVCRPDLPPQCRRGKQGSAPLLPGYGYGNYPRREGPAGLDRLLR